jgi:hypothetical protein
MTTTNLAADFNDVTFLQSEIAAAEQRIQAEIERIASLAEFQELTVEFSTLTNRHRIGRDTVAAVSVKIRAVL